MKQTVVVAKLIQAVIPEELQYTTGSMNAQEIMRSGLFSYFTTQAKNSVFGSAIRYKCY